MHHPRHTHHLRAFLAAMLAPSEGRVVVGVDPATTDGDRTVVSVARRMLDGSLVFEAPAGLPERFLVADDAGRMLGSVRAAIARQRDGSSVVRSPLDLHPSAVDPRPARDRTLAVIDDPYPPAYTDSLRSALADLHASLAEHPKLDLPAPTTPALPRRNRKQLRDERFGRR